MAVVNLNGSKLVVGVLVAVLAVLLTGFVSYTRGIEGKLDQHVIQGHPGVMTAVQALQEDVRAVRTRQNAIYDILVQMQRTDK